MPERASVAINDQETGFFALRGRVPGDQLAGKGIVVGGEFVQESRSDDRDESEVSGWKSAHILGRSQSKVEIKNGNQLEQEAVARAVPATEEANRR